MNDLVPVLGRVTTWAASGRKEFLMIRNSRVTMKPECSGSTNFDENYVQKNKSQALKGRMVLVFFVERAPVWGGMFCTKMASLLSSVSTASSTHPAGMGTLSLPFLAFSSSNPRDLLLGEGRVEVNG